jgi:LysR family cyn operon transcriptional activator
VHLTEAGQVHLVRARRAVEELETAGKEIEAMSGLLRGTLTIATVPLFGSKVLPTWIDAFCLLHPSVHVKVRAARAEDIESGLIAGTFDLGFSLAPPEHSELNMKEIMADQIVLVVSKDHPLAKKKKLVPADLDAVSMALPSHKISSLRLIGTYFETVGISPNITIEQDDGHALLELVKLGGFVTFLPQLALRYDPDVCLLNLPEPGIPIHFAAMWTQLTAAASAFLDISNYDGAAPGKANPD